LPDIFFSILLENYLLALQRYTDFAAKGIVPEEFPWQSGGLH